MDIIYVQSRGISKEYCWLDQNQTRISDLPDNLKRMLKMVDGDYFSLVIYRANGQLSLLVTALKSQNRIDNRTRKICNSLLWVGKDDDEATLRKLAIQALNGELAAKVDPAVVSENNDRGFTVNFDLLKPEKLGLPSVESNPPDDEEHKKHKVGNLSACKNELIGELDKYALPKRDGMLVVVGSTVSKSSLEREQVWRGLSDAISDDGWIDISSADSKKSSKENKGDNFRRQPFSSNHGTNISSQSEKSKSGTTSTPSSGLPTSSPTSSRNDKRTPEDSPIKKWIPIIFAFLIGLLIGIVGHYLYYTNIPNRQKEQIRQNEETISGQKQTISGQKQTIAAQEDTIAKKANTIEQEDKLIKDIRDYTKEFIDRGSPLVDRANALLSNEVINGIQK